MAQDAPDELLTPTQVCDMLRVTRGFLSALVRSGEIPVIILGPRTRRFRRSDLDAWLASR